ncbi:Splicing factor U2af large subunit B-like protein [Drosera capensis]
MGGGEFPPEDDHAATGDDGNLDRPHRRKPSRWDEPPPSSTMLLGGGGRGGAIILSDLVSGAVRGLSGTFPVMHPFGEAQATRNARRVYVGSLPPTATEQSVAIFFNHAMEAIGGNTAGPGDAVVSVYVDHGKKFAFVEMRSIEEASNAMALEGIIFEGTSAMVRRPSDYNPPLVAVLGPSQPNPNLNLAAVGLGPWSATPEGPDRIFVGGLPYYFTEAQVRELLESFGHLRGFEFVKDRETGNSKGYAFCTDIVCMALNGIKMGDRTLSVRRADQASTQPTPQQDNVILDVAFQNLKLSGTSPTARPTKVVCLLHTVTVDDEKYESLMDGIRQEAERSGGLVNIVIPQPGLVGEVVPGVGKVFLELADPESGLRAKEALAESGKQVLAF